MFSFSSNENACAPILKSEFNMVIELLDSPINSLKCLFLRCGKLFSILLLFLLYVFIIETYYVVHNIINYLYGHNESYMTFNSLTAINSYSVPNHVMWLFIWDAYYIHFRFIIPIQIYFPAAYLLKNQLFFCIIINFIEIFKNIIINTYFKYIIIMWNGRLIYKL